MAEPTAELRNFPNTTLTTAVDTPAERLALATGSLITTGAGNELDFSTIDISGGAANSAVKHLMWEITANGGNTTVEDFRTWIPAATIGFDQAGSVVKFVAVSGADKGSPSNTENYVANATTSSYTFATLGESDPGSQNIYPSDEGTSMSISGGASDDTVMWAVYLAIASGETTGTYKGTDSGKELQFKVKYSYS